MTTRNGRMRVLLVAPTALDYCGRPIKQRRLHLPGLTLPMLAAVTPADIDLRLVSETTEDIPFDEPWDLETVPCGTVEIHIEPSALRVLSACG